MTIRPQDWLCGMGSKGRAIIKSVLNDHGIHPEDFFSKSRQAHIVEARLDAVKRMKELGYSNRRIGHLIKRDPSTITYYFHDGIRRSKREVARRHRALRLLAPDAAAIVVQCASAEQVSVEMLISQWVSERARYEAGAKARAAA